jgi:hypothetical protein
MKPAEQWMIWYVIYGYCGYSWSLCKALTVQEIDEDGREMGALVGGDKGAHYVRCVDDTR